MIMNFQEFDKKVQDLINEGMSEETALNMVGEEFSAQLHNVPEEDQEDALMYGLRSVARAFQESFG